MTERAGVGTAILGTIGVGATAETFEDAMPIALTSCALLLLYGAGFATLEMAMRRASALAAKSQPSQLKVSAQHIRLLGIMSSGQARAHTRLCAHQQPTAHKAHAHSSAHRGRRS
jgi:hypothetical protein